MYKKILTMASCVLILYLTGCTSPVSTYEKAAEAMKEENWDEAIKLYDSISEYEDSKQLSQECKVEKEKHEKADYEFLETIAEAIMTRYEKSHNGESLETCISYDLTNLSKYKEAEFFDEELQELALQYIEGVELQQSALTEVAGEKQMKNYEGLVKRFSALKSLTDEYGLLNDNVDYMVNYYNESEKITQEFEAFKEIEKSLENLFIESEAIYYNLGQTIYHNNTNSNFEMIVFFSFKDKNGQVIETTEEYYKIAANSTNKLNFYFPDGTDSWDYATEEYIYY